MSLPPATRLLPLVIALAAWLAPAWAQEMPLETDGLPDNAERVLYSPLPDDVPARLKRQEIPLTARYFRSSGLAELISPVLAEDPAVFQAVEAGLVMDARQGRCADVEGAQVSGYIETARKAIAAGSTEKAAVALDMARRGLPCATRKIGRRQLGELFLFNGLVALDKGLKKEGEIWVKSALAVDSDLKTSPLIPEKYAGDLERLAFEAESEEKVDTRLSPDQGDLWLPRNLVIDGRRMIFDRMFLEMVPGYHFVQVTLPDDNTWGALLFVEAGQIYDLIEGVRGSLNLRELFNSQLEKALKDGVLEPALAQGLRYYARTLKRDQIYLAALMLETKNQARLVVRRFLVEGKLEVPEQVSAEEIEPGSGTVLVQFVPPWGLDVTMGFAQMQNGELAYKSSGLDLEVSARYLLSQQFYLGASVSGGARFAAKVNGLEVSEISTDPDLALSGFAGLDVPAGPISVRTDLGYIRHVYPLTNIPFDCALGAAAGGADGLLYSCSDDPAEIAALANGQEVIPFSFESRGGGPRIRLALVFSPFVQDVIQLQGIVRGSYTPLVVNIPQSGSGVVDDVQVDYEFLSGSNTQLFHRLDVAFGISGTF